MNKHERAPYLGRFIVDFYTNSLKYIFKIIVTDSLKESDELITVLGEVVADLKHRISKNLFPMLLAVGDTYATFTRDRRLLAYRRQEEMLQSEVEAICLSQEEEEIEDEDEVEQEQINGSKKNIDVEGKKTVVLGQDLVRKVQAIRFGD